IRPPAPALPAGPAPEGGTLERRGRRRLHRVERERDACREAAAVVGRRPVPPRRGTGDRARRVLRRASVVHGGPAASVVLARVPAIGAVALVANHARRRPGVLEPPAPPLSRPAPRARSARSCTHSGPRLRRWSTRRASLAP